MKNAPGDSILQEINKIHDLVRKISKKEESEKPK